MPMSNLLHLPVVIHFAGALRPKRILDIGVGIGTYGLVLRQYLDISSQVLDKTKWATVIDGIEIFEPYRNPVWEYAYNRIFVGDIRTLIDQLERYDVVLCNDVLEHLELDEARALISKLLADRQTVIATTPNVDFPQGPWAGNQAEAHRCSLQANDFPDVVTLKRTGVTTCFVCTRRNDHIAIMKKTRFNYPINKEEIMRRGVEEIKRLAGKVFEVAST